MQRAINLEGDFVLYALLLEPQYTSTTTNSSYRVASASLSWGQPNTRVPEIPSRNRTDGLPEHSRGGRDSQVLQTENKLTLPRGGRALPFQTASRVDMMPAAKLHIDEAG